ncbi:MAG: ABC transporter ATP-binding protein [Eggerthellaceae bacterium]|jgi:NitT/TauT family transport system ATP-binding protein
MALIEIENVEKTYNTPGGGTFTALSGVNLTVERGEFVCLLGPSGCGKSTLLNAVAGFDLATGGSVRINGKEVAGPSPEYVTIFQAYGLFPWRTVLENVELGLEQKKGLSKQEVRATALKYIELVGLSDFADAHPSQLSGGMQQRVSIARGLAVDPEILFMDEPFGALDAITRMKLQDDVRTIAKETDKTVLFVTHDIEEAVYLADRIVVMAANPGRVSQIVDVPISQGFRERTSEDFLAIRDKAFRALHMKHELPEDYTI